MSKDPMKELKQREQELKHEVSELGRQLELRGRDLTAARKKAAKVDELQEELDKAHAAVELGRQKIGEQNVEIAHLRSEAEKANTLREDVEALKRLVR